MSGGVEETILSPIIIRMQSLYARGCRKEMYQYEAVKWGYTIDYNKSTFLYISDYQ